MQIKRFLQEKIEVKGNKRQTQIVKNIQKYGICKSDHINSCSMSSKKPVKNETLSFWIKQQNLTGNNPKI